MPQLNLQSNVANPLNIIIGEATLYYAPYTTPPTAVPTASLAIGSPWPAPWVSPGATETGVIWSVASKDTDHMIDEQPNPVATTSESQDYTIEVTLAEDTLSNMLLAYGMGSIASTAPTGGRTDPTCGTTSGSATVTDAACVAADLGKTVAGTGVPFGATVVAVTAGVSFTLSQNATATGSVSLAIGGTGGFQRLTFSINKNQYSFGFEATNLYQKPRRVYLPLGVILGAKVDATYQRAKVKRMYKTTFRALCPPNQLTIDEYDS